MTNDYQLAKNIAINERILLGEVGSVAHGTGKEGQEDRDEMGIFVEPKSFVMGLSQLDHYIYRDQPEGVKSGPGDLDLTVYSLRKFCRLAAGGNPSILLLLWLPNYIEMTPVGEMLVLNREMFVTHEAGRKYIGYLNAQLRQLIGERAPNRTRPELICEHGYDTKFAMHALRLGLQGLELIRYGRLTIPVQQPDRELLLSVRYGKLQFSEVCKLILDAERQLQEAVDGFQREIDPRHVSKLMVDMHEKWWNRDR